MKKTTLRIVEGRPPNYEEIVERIGRPPAGAVFTWGEKLFVPKPPLGFHQELGPVLMAHEETHSRQQAIVGGPVAWWRRYIDDVDFRRQQETAAYQNQYLFAHATGISRQQRRELLRRLAKDFAGPMYGSIIKRTEAMAAISG
jgi:hypothetical protein